VHTTSACFADGPPSGTGCEIDVPTTRSGGLAVLELKADDDIHLPLQGLDYRARALAPPAGRVPTLRLFWRA
jgi:hypothetical protein